MSTIQEFKKQYPAYQSVPDEELAAALHSKFYSSMPRDAFMERVGLGEASFLERASDFGLDVSRGVVGLGESVIGVADLLTGNRTGNALRDTINYNPKRTKDIIAEGYSAERRRENAAVQDAEGFVGTVEALIDNPGVALGSMAESAPMMLGSAAAVRAAAVRMLGAAGIAPGTQAAAAYLRQPGVVAKLATIGSATEGATAAGSIQSEARQEGREWADSAPYAVAGGVGTAVIGKAASKLLPDVDVGLGVAGLGAGGRTSALEAAQQISRGTIQEGILEELPQSAQEQVAQNLAMGKPWDEGVSEAAAQGMVAGLGMGAGGSGARVALDSYTARTADATSGIEFNPTAIEAAARAQLDPGMAQMELRRRADAAQADISNAQSIPDAVDAFANATQATSDDLNRGTLQTEAIIGQREAAAIDQADLLRRAQLAAGLEQEADLRALPTMPEFSAGMGYGQPLDVAPLEQMPAGMPLDLRLPEREEPIQTDRAPTIPDFTAGAGFGQRSEVMPLDQAPASLPIEGYTPEPQPEPFPVAPGTPTPDPRPPVDVPYANTTIDQARAAIQADPMRPKTAQLEGVGVVGTFSSKTAATVAARIVRKALPDAQLDVVQQGKRWALVPKQAPTTTPSAARPFDHGELNIPGRTKGIDAELDRWKADQAKAKRAQAKTDAATRKAQKAEAQQLFTQFGPAMIERYAPKFGRKEVERELDSMVKWEPAKFIDLVQRFEREERAAAPDAAPPPATPDWQLTPDEFIDSDIVRRATINRADLNQQHFDDVKAAVQRGELVPDRVLVNYSAIVRPDLNDDQRDLMLDEVRGTTPEEIVSGWRTWGRSTPDIPTRTATPEAAPAQAPQMDMQQDTPLLQGNGRPFKNAKLAATSAKQRGFDMRPVKVDGGWGLVPTEQAPLPKPWELNQDDFVALAQIEKDGSRWSARWDGQYLQSDPEVIEGKFGKTLANGARFFGKRAEAEFVARRAHRQAVKNAIERGEQVAPEIVALYPELNAQAGTAPAAAPQLETETTNATPSTPAAAPAFAPGQTAKGRDVLLAQVEQLKQRTAPADLVKDYNDLKERIADARRRASLKGTKRAEAERLTSWADNQDRELERLRNAIGFVGLRAGTSRFKVLNTPQNLEAFAQKLKKAPVGRWSITVQPDEIYDNVETRPGTTEKQRDAGRSAIAALVDRVNARSVRAGGGSAQLLGNRLLESFAGTGGADLVGQKVSSAEDLATLAQIYRDPRFETFRVFYTDASGAIVGEAAYSSRLPAAVLLPNDFEARITADMGRFGAAGFWVSHNHPSGRATPSDADVRLTLSIARGAPGFQGHAVIDHNEYATIDAAGVVSVIKAPQLMGADFFATPALDHAMLGTVLQGEQDVVKAAKALQVPQGHAALILTRRDNAVQLLMDVPMAMLQAQTSKDLGKLKGALRGFARESGSGGHRFIVLPDGVSPEPFKKLVTSGLVTDVVSADGTTAGNFGAFWTGDFLDQNMPIRRVKEDDQPSRAQTDTAAFRRWFGDSKVVDENGNPLVVYHGTAGDFSEFSKDVESKHIPLPGFFFTPEPAYADRFAESAGREFRDEDGYIAGSEGANVIPVYLSLQNPFIEDLTKSGQGGFYPASAIKEMIEYAQSKGHDGVILKGWQDGSGPVQYIAFRPEQIKSAVGNNGNFDPTDPSIVRDPAAPYQAGQPQPAPSTPPAETRARAFQRRTQDKFNRFTVIQDWLRDRGIDLTEQADVYRAEERMHGRAATRIEDFREKRLKPVVDNIRKAGFDLATVADFLHAQHAEERNEQIARLNSEMPDGGSGMTTADARAKLAQYRTQPELVRLANELQAITQDTKRILLEAGIITQEMAAAWDATYQHYVPLKGGPEEDAANQGTGRGLTVKQKNKRALGHGTREEWIIENILRDHERAILQAEKNRVGQHLLTLAIEAGHEDLITIGKPAKRQVLKDTVHYEVRYHGSTVEVFRNLADAQRYVGVESLKAGRSKKDFSIATSHDLDVVMMPSPVLEPNETQVYVDGHAVRVQFKDEGLARAWNNLGAESFNVVMRMAREVNTFLSRAYTGWNPEFILVNVFRDLGTGVLNLTGEEGGRFAMNALKNYPRAFAELLKYAHTGNASNWIAQYRADGGTTGAAYLSDLERIGKDVQAAYDEAAGVIQTWRNGGSYRAARAAVREVLGPFVRWIEKLNQAGENAMRLAAYRTAVEMGQSRARAAALAKNSTVNFNRNGELGQTIGSLYLFANPAIQGTASIAHALFKGKHKHQAQALTGAIVAAGYTMAALNGGGPEDEYEKLPEFQKERFMPIWTGDGWVKIPIPYGYGFFATMGRQLAALEKGEDPAKVSLRLAASFAEEFSVWGAAADPEGDEKNVTFLLPTIPQIVMAPIITKTGLGAPVYPESPFDQSKPDNLKMWRTTQGTVFHDTAKGLNALTGGDAVQKGWIDISPETLRYLWTTATGGTGRFFTDTAALAKNLAVEGLEPGDVESREVPIVRKFISPANDIRGARARFWEAAEEVREAQEAFARAKKLEDVAERNDLARQIQAENRELLALGKALDARTKAIKAERDTIDAIMADESRTLSERRAMVREVEARERRLYDEFVSTFKERTK